MSNPNSEMQRHGSNNNIDSRQSQATYPMYQQNSNQPQGREGSGYTNSRPSE